MQLCTGVDMLEIQRIQKSLENPRFLQRFFSPQEVEQYRCRGGHPSFLAGCFCAKEAFGKALGTGIRGFAFQEVAVLRDKLGKPYLQLAGNAKHLAEERGLVFDVSISNTREYAIAFVVGVATTTNKGAEEQCW